MSLPQFQATLETVSRVFNQMQSVWAQVINPVITRPQNNSTILPKVSLAIGDNTIPHTLNREIIGWSVVRYRGSWAEIYEDEDNTRTDTNLILNASAAVTVDLEVF